jgi:hypothetical protein
LTDFSFVAEWMESWAASHAQTYPLQASKPESTESIRDSGLNTSASFAKCNPDGSLLKTSPQLSLIPQEELYSEGLPKAGSMRSGYLFERPTWERPTAESACSSWPTPTANDDNKTPEAHLAMKQRMGERDGSFANRMAITSLQVKVQVWPSPRSEDSECCGNHPGATDSLTGATKQWKTPHGLAGKDCSGVGGEFAKQANQWATPRAGVKVSEASLNFPSSRPDPPTPKDGSDSSPTTPGSRRRLNPAFGCLLMAWPWWWTQTEPISFAQSAMAAYRSRLRRHLLNCLAGQGLTGGGR